MKLSTTTKQYLIGGFFYSAVLSLFFGYIIGAAAIVIIAVFDGILSVANGAKAKQTFKENGTVIAGAIAAVAASVAVSGIWKIV